MEREKIWEKIIKDLTEEQVTNIVTDLGSLPPRRDNENNLVFQSICHHSDSWKLCYYKDTHNFFCYRDWESFNIFGLVMQVKDCDFPTALKYVADKLDIRLNEFAEMQGGFESNYTKSDWDLFDKFDRLQNHIKTNKDTKYYNPNILNLYSDIYYQGWVGEHISIQSMKKYNIKYDMANSRIIIPHYDIENNLIGIRCRNLDPIAEAKYCPVYINNDLYNHSLSSNFYGLNHNKNIIRKIGKVMIVESEKSVLQCETYFPENNFVLACCGSNVSNEQIQILLSLGITEVILGMDWDFKEMNNADSDYLLYKKKILKLCQKLIPYFSVKVLLPIDEKFLYKCSPSDLGKEYLLNSMRQKRTVDYEIICNEKELQLKKEQEGKIGT